MAKIILGVTGSIAAFKGAALASLLVRAGHDVHAVLTRNACQFIAPLTFQAITSNRVAVDMFAEGSSPHSSLLSEKKEKGERRAVALPRFDPSHVALARDASLLTIAPASANILAKMAAGIADDMLSTTFLCVDCPVLAAPAMHANMYANAAVQENIRLLADRGVHFIGPGEGRLASGDVGPGRMTEPPEIAREIEKLLQRS